MKHSLVYEIIIKTSFLNQKWLCKSSVRKSLKYISLSDDNLSSLAEIKSWGFLRRSEVDCRVSCGQEVGAPCIMYRWSPGMPSARSLRSTSRSWQLSPSTTYSYSFGDLCMQIAFRESHYFWISEDFNQLSITKDRRKRMLFVSSNNYRLLMPQIFWLKPI